MSERIRYGNYIQSKKISGSGKGRVLALTKGVSMQFSVPVSVRLDKGLFADIKRWAKNNSIGIGAAIRFLLCEALKAKGEVSSPHAAN